MKKFVIWAVFILMSLVFAGLASAANDGCTRIQDGILLISDIYFTSYDFTDDGPIQTGFDDYGYNYQAMTYNGNGCGFWLDVDGCDASIDVLINWNDDFLSNKDCNGDGHLDRHLGFPNYQGSGAWLTFQSSGKREIEGKMRKWSLFQKVIAVPADAELTWWNEWYTIDGDLIGPAAHAYGGYGLAIVEVIDNPSPDGWGEHGLYFKSESNSGLGNN
jgi:hypothetical protein